MTLDELDNMIDNKQINAESLKKIEECVKESDDAKFIAKVGILYRTGLCGFPKDSSKSFIYSLKAANMGNTKAMHIVAMNYNIGFGCDKNKSLGFEWNLKGAKLNDPLCIQAVAEAYLSGQGVSPDRNKALMWYQKGAELNNGSCIRALIRYFKIDYFGDGNVGF